MNRDSLLPKGCKVLELGAGLGLCGFVAGGLLSKAAEDSAAEELSHVCISDYSRVLVKNLERNVTANNALVTIPMSVRKLDWYDYKEGKAPPQNSYDIESFDLIIGSALIYSPDHAVCADVILHFLQQGRKGAVAIVCQILDRCGFKDSFLVRCKTLGLSVDIEPVSEETVFLAEQSIGKKLMGGGDAFGICKIRLQ